jgi:ABC-type multidrug transport system ATPase subunit
MREREKNLVNKITGSFQFQPVSNPLTLTFDHLYYTLHSNGISILKDIYGQFLPYNITALMGSSGAGKTTLLSLLRGKTSSGTISGEIYVNKDKVGSLAPFSNCMGFVPQDDIMYDELTVSENLKYAAMLFNRRGYVNIPEVLPMVHHTMELLGLSFIKHSIVGKDSLSLLFALLFRFLTFPISLGSPSVKGISGGQKKRVSIGMELMKEPALFFLDEPTRYSARYLPSSCLITLVVLTLPPLSLLSIL